MKTIFKSFSGIIAVGLLLTACVKKTEEYDTDTSSASENFLATGVANDMGSISDEAGRSNSVSSFKSSEASGALIATCATLKFDTLVSSNADSITVNFGSSNCLCNDQRYRRGSLLITYTGKYRDSLTTITITPLGYFVNDNGVGGSKVVKNLGHNAQGHLVYDITENLTIKKADNTGTITLDAKRQREWLTGENTLIWSDDKYSITGSATGSNANGRKYESVITKPLVKDMSLACRRHFVSGEMVHSPQNKPKRSIDFGNGNCDDKATVTINGKSYEVTLP
jgi:hypothetical protein